MTQAETKPDEDAVYVKSVHEEGGRADGRINAQVCDVQFPS